MDNSTGNSVPESTAPIYTPVDEFCVVQSNEFAQMSYTSMTLNQLRVLYFLLSSIQQRDDMFCPIRVDVPTLRTVMECSGEYSDRAKQKSYIDRTVEKMLSLFYKVYDKSTGKWQGYPWFKQIADFPAFDGEGYLFQFNDSLCEYFLGLSRNFTRYRLGNVLSFQSVYAFRMYNILSSSIFAGAVTYSFKQFHRLMAMQDDTKEISKFKEPKEFIRRVIKPGLAEINEKSDVYITYEIIKDKEDARKTGGFRFTITRKEGFVPTSSSAILSCKMEDIDTLPSGSCNKIRVIRAVET